MAESAPSGSSGQALREALVRYVRALHEAYLRTAKDHGAVLDHLPLAGAPFTVAVVAADRLHVVATRHRLPRQQAHEQIEHDRAHPLDWQVRFLDSSVVDALATIEDTDPAAIRDVLGIGDTLYHLQVELQAALTPHQAAHAGTALANAHLGRS